jgi:hypothetical protein
MPGYTAMNLAELFAHFHGTGGHSGFGPGGFGGGRAYGHHSHEYAF